MVTSQYARSGDLYLVYRVTGTGSVDLLCAPPIFVSFDSLDEEARTHARFNRRLASFARLIKEYDPRGTGLSEASAERVLDGPCLSAMCWPSWMPRHSSVRCLWV